MKLRTASGIVSCVLLLPVDLSGAEDPAPVAVATDQASDDERAAIVTDIEGRAVVDAVVREIENQGGSIVPPWFAGSSDQIPETSRMQRDRQARPQPSRADQYQPIPWQIEQFRQARPTVPFSQHSSDAPQQRPQESPRSKSNTLRDVSWQLENLAHRLEVDGLYDEADAIRETASSLRQKSRELAKGEKSKRHKPQDRRDASRPERR